MFDTNTTPPSRSSNWSEIDKSCREVDPGAAARSSQAARVRLRRAALLICLVFGLATVTPVRMIVGIAAGLGGLVLMGAA